MRKGVFLTGLILIIIGGIFMGLSLLPKSVQSQNNPNVSSWSYDYGSTSNHAYQVQSYLVSGTYQVHYIFDSQDQTLNWGVVVLDPDGAQVKYDSGSKTETVLQGCSYEGDTSFEIQKVGEYNFTFGGNYFMIRADLQELVQTTETTYPYEAAVYFGLVLLIAGGIISIFGALSKTPKDKQVIQK